MPHRKLNKAGVTAYAVSQGSYSDYQVLCLFTTKELAKQYVEVLIEKDWIRNSELPNESVQKLWVNPVEREKYYHDTKAAGKEAFVLRMFDMPYTEEFTLWSALPVVDDA